MNIAENEQEFLSCILKKPELIKSTSITEEHFYFDQHKDIYRSMLELDEVGLICDIPELGDVMRDSMKESYILATEIFKGNWSDPKQFSRYNQRMYQAKQARSASDIATTLINNLSRGKVHLNIEKAIAELSALSVTKQKHSHILRDGLVSFYEKVNEAQNSDDVMGVDTGIEKLTSLLGGFNKTDLIIIQARSGMGKTALMLNMAYAPKQPVGIFSAEQGVAQAAGRILALHGRVDAEKMRTGSLGREEVEDFGRAFTTLDNLKGESIFINDQPSISIHDLKRQARRWKNESDIKAIYVDYIQKMAKPDKSMSKFESVSANIGMLKDLARELNIPVIVLAQTKREVDLRDDSRPTPADVSDSSDIEKEADVFISLYRDDRYEPDPAKHNQTAEIIVCKNRHGRCARVMAKFEAKFMKFVDADEIYRGER